MDARTERTLVTAAILLVTLIICTGIVVLFPMLDPRFIAAVYGLGIAAAGILSQWVQNSGDNAPPTVAAVNEALQTRATSVRPPNVKPVSR